MLRRAKRHDCCIATTPESARQKCFISPMEWRAGSDMLWNAYKVVLFMDGERLELGLPLFGVRC